MTNERVEDQPDPPDGDLGVYLRRLSSPDAIDVHLGPHMIAKVWDDGTLSIYQNVIKQIFGDKVKFVTLVQ